MMRKAGWAWLLLAAGLGGAGSGWTKEASLEGIAAAVATDAPVDLRVENASMLLGTDVARPRLSWLAPPGTTSFQTHYQIQVAASPAALSNGELLWDSGVTASARHTQISYAGPPLLSRRRYAWRVRTYHGAAHPSGWSQAGEWEMGLLQTEDWKARWIAADRQTEHVWADATVEWRFTPRGAPADFLFRASPVGKTFGEAYAWRLDPSGVQPKLIAISRTYDGSGQAVVRENILKSIQLPLSSEALLDRPHILSIQASGRTIVTRFDGRIVDRLENDDHLRGTVGIFQPGGDDAAKLEPSDALVLHRLEVTPATGPATVADFARNLNPLSGGTVESDGLRPANAKGIDIVFPQGGPAPLLRKMFNVRGGIVSARLYVAAGGFPRLEINGSAINEAIGDGFTAYDRRVLYRTFDVTDRLKDGANVIGAELGRGWYDLAEPNEWYWHAPPWRDRPALLLQLEITLADGSRRTIASDGSWRARPGPTLHDSIYAGERYDARLLHEGWTLFGFDDRGWHPVALVRGPAGRLDAAEQQPIAVVATRRPVALKQVRPGVWVYDFGGIFAGRVRLKVRGPAGQTVTLIQHEKLRPDGTVKAISTHIDAQLQTDHYTLAGKGAETWAPQFGYRGFRYVEVRGFPGEPTLDNLTGEVMHSDVASTGSFESSNPLLDRIQQTARTAILNNMHGFQTDTPTFEKNGWTGDAQASALAAALNFDIGRVWTKWMADFRDAQSPKGEIPEIVPSTPLYGYENTPGWSMIGGPTPSWDAAAFVLPDDLYQLTGDTRILVEMYETQKRLLDYTLTWFTPGDYRYRQDTNVALGEYAFPRLPDAAATRKPSPDTPGDVAAVSAAYLYFMTDRLARNAALLGFDADARSYAARAVDIRAAFNRTYWDQARRFYRVPTPVGDPDFVQYHNVLPVAFGIVPDGEAGEVMRKVAQDIAAHDYHLSSMGIYSGRYALRLLSDYGHVDTAYKVVSQTSEPSWGYWLSQDTDTMLEMWDLGSRSHNHHYWASVSSWFFQGLAGIRPGRPGYETIVIRPTVPRDLQRVSAHLDTMRGRISSEWHQANGVVTLDVTVPAGAHAEVQCPGKQFIAPAGASRSRISASQKAYFVAGGSHRFVCAPIRGTDRSGKIPGSAG